MIHQFTFRVQFSNLADAEGITLYEEDFDTDFNDEDEFRVMQRIDDGLRDYGLGHLEWEQVSPTEKQVEIGRGVSLFAELIQKD